MQHRNCKITMLIRKIYSNFKAVTTNFDSWLIKHAEQILLEVESGSIFVDLGSIFDLRWKSEVVWDRPDRCKVSGADSDFQVNTLER